MNRIIVVMAIALLISGCQKQEQPTLRVTITGEGYHSKGTYKIFRPGPVTGSEDGSSEEQGAGHAIEVDELTADGVTLSISLWPIPE